MLFLPRIEYMIPETKMHNTDAIHKCTSYLFHVTYDIINITSAFNPKNLQLLQNNYLHFLFHVWSIQFPGYQCNASDDDSLLSSLLISDNLEIRFSKAAVLDSLSAPAVTYITPVGILYPLHKLVNPLEDLLWEDESRCSLT